MYRIGICDDEKLQVKVNGLYVTEISKREKLDVEVVGFTSATKLDDYIKQKGLDILLLDIDMGEESGISIATKIMDIYPELIIIFVTGHSEFAVDAFDLDAVGYILKPVEEHKVERAIKKAVQQIEAKKLLKPSSEIIITVDNLKKKIKQSDIYYIERQQTKSVIYINSSEERVYETITSILDRLDDFFIRVSQSAVVNMNHINHIKDRKVIMNSGVDIPIGRTYFKDVKECYYSI